MGILKIKDDNDSWVSTITGGVGLPSGGSTNQVLKKTSNMNFNATWQTLTLEDVGIFIVSTAPTSASPDGLYFVTSS